MPGWQAAVEPHVKAGTLVVIGVLQEQHPDRARLYRQWRRLDWPLFIDALNTLRLRAVPVPVGVDEAGIVRFAGRVTPETVRAFVEREPVPAGKGPVAPEPDPEKVTHPRERGDAFFLFGKGPDALDRAVDAYAKAAPDDADARFRLGVAHRARYDSPRRRPDDAQKAVAAWGEALAMKPNQYIWRRRIQQYGPRLDKPYNFFFWVEQARKEIRARGETPVELVAEPMGSEIAPPSRGKASGGAPRVPDPDPGGKVLRDRKFVVIETAVTPARVRPGHRVRVRTTFRLNPAARPWWNNEADPLTLTVRLPAGLTLAEGTFTHPVPREAESKELRVLEFEAEVAASAKPGVLAVPGYAAYGVCEDVAGTCLYRRQDLRIDVTVDPGAPKIQ